MDRFDTELFIDEVEKRPAIWDVRCGDYSNKIAKNRAWQELAELFGDGEDSLEKNALFGTILQKKWKNIRDAYNKEYKKEKTGPSSSSARKGAQYMYFARLSFLQKCVENKKPTGNIEIEVQKIEESQDINDEEIESFVNITEKPPICNKKKKSNTLSEERLINIIEKSIRSRDKIQQELKDGMMIKEDEDKLFCLSLYKELKKVPENKRLVTKIELLQTIQRRQTLPSPLGIAAQHTAPNTVPWHSPQYSKQRGYFTAAISSSEAVPPASPSPSSSISSDSQSSNIENTHNDIADSK